MHTKIAAIVDELWVWSRHEKNVEGVIIIGSQVRDELKADEWSDLDCMVLVNDPQSLMDEDGWMGQFGNVICVFNYVTVLHFTDWNWCVKRVLLEDNQDIDLCILPFNRLDEVLAVNQEILSKGYRVLYDSNGTLLSSKIGAFVAKLETGEISLPTEQELRNDLNDLLFHVIWAFKKIKRKELWVAVDCINQHIRGLLLRLIECHNMSVTRKSNIITYDGRFLEHRTDQEILGKLPFCFAKYDEADAINTLDHLIDVTLFISKVVFEKNGYQFDPDQFEVIRNIYSSMKENTERNIRRNVMSRNVVSTENAPAAVGAYSQAIAANNLVFVSGQLGIVPGTKDFVGDTVAAQTEQALKNMAAIVEAAGTDMAHVVKCTVLLADISTFAEMNEVYSTFFPSEPPARAAFAVRDLPLGGLVEIEAFAVLPD